MRLALISDIHGNREALEAVLSDAAARQISHFVVLGDIVGYGPDPAWCVERVMALAKAGAVVIRGNHDAAIAEGGRDMNPQARAAIDWSRPRLTQTQRDWLATLPLTQREGEILFTHASAHSPGDWIYVTSGRDAMASFRSSDARVIFCGHVHIPALYSCDLVGRVHDHQIAAQVASGNALPLLPSRRWLAVLGAVGQPRDGSPAAAWAIFDRDRQEISFRRTAYDHALTARKLRGSDLAPAIAEALAERLREGQ
ncbi:metallophosphoesterase [Xinfangfangia sp. D13-10-4-6]|nr:metallophosphoesterase [Pseudogemmobacter hezensis]